MGIFLHCYNNNKNDLGYVKRKLKISQYLEQKVCLQVRRISELLPYALVSKAGKTFVSVKISMIFSEWPLTWLTTLQI